MNEELNQRVKVLELSKIFLDEPKNPKLDTIYIDRTTKVIKIWDGKQWI